MGKRGNGKKPTKGSTTVGMDKIFIPGINLTELLKFEDIFPNLRDNLAKLLFPVVLIAQIRLMFPTLKPSEIQSLSSVNSYNRNMLAKSEPLVGITASAAIRKTIAEYANDNDSNRIVSDYYDLISNLSGPITTRGGLASVLGDPAKLRAYRRGIMAQLVGSLQSTPIHSPRRIHCEVEKITPNNYLSLLPFNTSDIEFDKIKSWANECLSATQDSVVEFVDTTITPTGTAPMEQALFIRRIAPTLPDISKAPAGISNLPAWKKASINQVRRMGGKS